MISEYFSIPEICSLVKDLKAVSLITKKVFPSEFRKVLISLLPDVQK